MQKRVPGVWSRSIVATKERPGLPILVGVQRRADAVRTLMPSAVPSPETMAMPLNT